MGAGKIRALFFALAAFGAIGAPSWAAPVVRDGDLIFQTSLAGQGVAIQKATGSPYTHVGLVFVKDGKPYVFEAAQTVRFTPLSDFIRRGDDGRYVIKRLADADRVLTPEAVKKMRTVAASFAGRPYDLQFLWSDDKIYCSELAWKIYDRALGIKIGGLRRIGDYQLGSPEVQEKMRERYGDAPPLDEPVTAPSDLFDAKELVLVEEGP